MNLQRLRFAWVRGARIQVPQLPHEKRKVFYTMNFSTYAPYEGCRIHPDDEHLQYGAVSTAFRDMALYTDSVDLDEVVEMFMNMAGEQWIFGPPFFCATGVDDFGLICDFARLFWAEFLADEGL